MRRDLHGDVVDLSWPMQDASEAARARLRQTATIFGGEGVPVVVIIDDATWADEDTVDMIEELLGTAAPVFAVATVRPDPFEQQVHVRSGFGRLTRDFESRTRVVRLESLTDDAMAKIVRARAPWTDPSVVAQIVSWASGNPLVLGGVLEVPVIAGSLADGAYRLANVGMVLAKLPKDYRGVLEQYWEMLPVSLQQLLAIASYHGLLVQSHSLIAGYRGAFGETTDPQALGAQARDPRLAYGNRGVARPLRRPGASRRRSPRPR